MGSNWQIKNPLSVLYIFLTLRLLAFSHFLQEKEVMKWKDELLEQRRKMMEEKLLHADLKRELQLQAIVKKAQEEEAKVQEGIPWKAVTICMWQLRSFLN